MARVCACGCGKKIVDLKTGELVYDRFFYDRECRNRDKLAKIHLKRAKAAELKQRRDLRLAAEREAGCAKCPFRAKAIEIGIAPPVPTTARAALAACRAAMGRRKPGRPPGRRAVTATAPAAKRRGGGKRK